MLNRLLPRSEFVRNVLTLITGTTIAQAIPIAIGPILTRIYTPEEFGLYGIFIAIVSIVSVVATARYELAIIQPKLDKDVNHLVALSISVATFISMVALVLVLLFDQNIADFVDNQGIKPWLYFVPVSVFLVGVFQSCNYWHSRLKRYAAISKAKVAQSAGNVSINLVAAPLQVNGLGLILGHVLGQIVAVIVVLKHLIRSCRKKNVTSVVRCIALAKRYRNFPLWSTPGALLDSASMQLPVLLISRFFDVATAGFFNFTYRYIGGPLALVSQALAQVLLQKISTEDHRQVYPFVLLVLRRLLLASIPFVGVIYFFGEFVFGLVFGEAWRVAGQYASILIFSIAVRFIVSPLSMVLTLERNVKLGVCWQAMYFVSVTSTLIVVSDWAIMDFLVAFVIQDVALYGIYLCIILLASKRMTTCVE